MRDEDEGAEHENVPLPPGELPVPSPGDHDHRLGQQREREREGEDEPGRAPPVEPGVAERREPEERQAPRGEDELPAVELLRRERVVERRALGERHERPDSHRHEERGEEEAPAPDDAAGPAARELDRGGGGEHPGDQQADGRRELEARVRSREEHARRRERVQPQEARARHEGERDEEQARVLPPARGHADGPAERGRESGRSEDEPEVRGVVLPALVDRGSGEQECQEDERRRHDERAMRASALSTTVLYGARFPGTIRCARDVPGHSTVVAPGERLPSSRPRLR